MGTCIICGTDVGDGHICKSHEEDVVFHFAGSRPDQLTSGRYYRGTVDGYADFGVFVDIGDHVTGLLHRSELDVRLESLDWEPGDAVYVQVKSVRDNGNIDLGWSIRQGESEFRGVLIDDPAGDRLPDEPDAEEAEPEVSAEPSDEPGAQPSEEPDEEPSEAEETAEVDTETAEPEPSAGTERTATRSRDGGAVAVEREAQAASEPEPTLVAVDSLGDRVGDDVRLEGEVVSVHQTSGPTVFELRDETGTVECAAFEEAGVRAYPEVDVDDVVRLDGEVERRRGQLQVETEALVVLESTDRDAVVNRLDAAIENEARPSEVELLADHDSVAAVTDAIVDAATTVRRAVMEGRPVVVRHSATADGYVAGAALERAVLPLVREEHARDDAEYHFFERRPLSDPVYDMDAATNDVTDMLHSQERHGEQLPLVVLVDAGSTLESRDGYGLLDIYEADRIVVDASHPDPEIVDDVSAIVNAHLEGTAEDVTTTALAANVAAHVNHDVRDDLSHLPAVSYWEDVPDVYAALAADAGVNAQTARDLREAIALEAFYQSYKDKRELVADILFDTEIDLASHVAEQFRIKLDDELATAEANVSVEEYDGVTVAVLDADHFTHRFDFPPTALLLDGLHRRQRDALDAPLVTLGLGEDELHLRSTAAIDVRELSEAVAEAVPEAGLGVAGGRDGYLTFLSGERKAVLDAAVDAITQRLA